MVDDATGIRVIDRVSHVGRARTHGKQGRDRRAAHLLHLVALR